MLRRRLENPTEQKQPYYNYEFMKNLLPLLLLLPMITACEIPEMVQNGTQDIHLDPLKHWSYVLKTYVNRKGEVDFYGVSRNPGDLNAFINYISRISPESNPSLFPTKKAKMAYYINAYNALAMHNIIESGIPKSLSGFRKILFFYFKKFTIGGKKYPSILTKIKFACTARSASTSH